MKVLDQFKEKRQTAFQNSVELTDIILARLRECADDVRKYVFVDQESNAVDQLGIDLGAARETKPSIFDTDIKASPKAVEAYLRLRDNCGFTYHIGNWFTIDQSLINRFSDVTLDHQWIHTDVERASRSPFKSTIAQGFLTLALIPRLTDGSNLSYEPYLEARFVVNIGLNKTRFPHPVKAGSRVRASKKILRVELLKRGIQVTEEITVEIENLAKPACVAETIIMLRL